MAKPTGHLLAWFLAVLAVASVPAGVVASDAQTGTAAESGSNGEGGGIPLAPIVLFGGAAALVAAYVRYAGRPPGTGPTAPPEPAREAGPPAGQAGPAQAEARQSSESGRETDDEPGPESGED